MIDHGTIERILDAAHIEQVVGEFVTLRRRGANYIACCPFHNEKTPSFSVSPSKGIYKCFGCGKAGNVVRFIMDHEQLSYVEALKYLGNKYNIPVDDQEETPQQAEDRLRRDSMMVVNAFAQQFYSQYLWENPMGQNIGLSYFRERGFTDASIKQFQLGYAPNGRDVFTKAARAAGYKDAFLTATGLTLHYEAQEGKPETFLDRYQDRVMFPIHSLSGRIIAFGGRTLRTDKQLAKYINSPESEIYVKSRSLYGIYFAKQHITRLQKCYLVEGYTDVISLVQAGVQNVVASSGTSLTGDQVRLIKRFAPKVTVLYDGDFAGIKASIRGIDMLLEEGLQVKAVLFPQGEDPDSFARSHSAQETQDFLDQHETDFIHFKIDIMSEDLKDPLQRANLVRDVMNSIAIVPDAITRSVYVEECSRQLDIEESLLSREVAKMRRKKVLQSKERAQRASQEPYYVPAPEDPAPVPVPEMGKPTKDRDLDQAEQDILYYLVKFGQTLWEDTGNTLANYIATELFNDDISLQDPLYLNLFNTYMSLTGDDAARHKQLLNMADELLVRQVMNILDNPHPINVKVLKDSLPVEESQLKEHVTKSLLVYKSRLVSKSCNLLTQQLHAAQIQGDTALMGQLMKQIKILTDVRLSFAKELNRLN